MHKLNSRYENELWNQRFTGAQDPNNFFYEASNNGISMATNEEIMNMSGISGVHPSPYMQNHNHAQASFDMGQSAISMSRMQEQISMDYGRGPGPQSMPLAS